MLCRVGCLVPKLVLQFGCCSGCFSGGTTDCCSLGGNCKKVQVFRQHRWNLCLHCGHYTWWCLLILFCKRRFFLFIPWLNYRTRHSRVLYGDHFPAFMWMYFSDMYLKKEEGIKPIWSKTLTKGHSTSLHSSCQHERKSDIHLEISISETGRNSNFREKIE